MKFIQIKLACMWQILWAAFISHRKSAAPAYLKKYKKIVVSSDYYLVGQNQGCLEKGLDNQKERGLPPY
jgi:hypothetical protein